ncbi:hypothetical protein JCM11957_12440 [Caminibacter profundus]
MKTIEIKVNDNKFEKIVNILESLKGGIIYQFRVKEIEKDFQEIKKEIKYLKKNNKSPQDARTFLNEL